MANDDLFDGYKLSSGLVDGLPDFSAIVKHQISSEIVVRGP
jgi:hypothetical protein